MVYANFLHRYIWTLTFETIVSVASRILTSAPAYPVIMDCFQIIQPKDVNRILGDTKLPACLLDLCPSWTSEQRELTPPLWKKVWCLLRGSGCHDVHKVDDVHKELDRRCAEPAGPFRGVPRGPKAPWWVPGLRTCFCPFWERRLQKGNSSLTPWLLRLWKFQPCFPRSVTSTWSCWGRSSGDVRRCQCTDDTQLYFHLT